MSAAIAIIGMACCYADARNPQELWENVLARRRAFRRLPSQRLSLQDYFSDDPEIPDAIYISQAALIGDYEFDRVHFRVAGPIFRSVDMTHWLALDVATKALKDANLLDGSEHDLPRETTGVLVGNTLTGEFSRAATLRVRWPYVRRVVESTLREQGWQESRCRELLVHLEKTYNAPFAPVGEETLAGALSNTIAGRICNHHHFGGGGYSLDGACCSSLLAVARACSALEAGEIDVALAGGVDLSLDPFELVGFAKAGALARGEMRVYDQESTGFLPGEGSGFVVLMRAEDAQARGARPYCLIRGWGISSDGGGSITRPELRGQVLALQRAYRRAAYGAETVALFEGHGTGTPVGDKVELHALSAARGAGVRMRPPAAIGSIKANIGHTKAAAGIAGLIKAALAVHHEVLPPTTGVRKALPEFVGNDRLFRVLDEAEPWPEAQALRAGINSFGFGGINVHVTIEGAEELRGSRLTGRLARVGDQDCELFLLTADSRATLAASLGRLAERAPGLSYAELSDLSSLLAEKLGAGPWRAAMVASSPAGLAERLETLRMLIIRDVTRHLDVAGGVFLGVASVVPRIGFLFPGQASPLRFDGGAHARRFPRVQELYRTTDLPKTEDSNSTRAAQLAIALAEIAGLRVLEDIGIEASVGIGHSLGELTAYCWADAIDECSLLNLVNARGKLMAEIPGPRGAMANISATSPQVEALIGEDTGAPIVIACLNAPGQIVVSGDSGSVARLVARARAKGWNTGLLPAAHAFHSPMMSWALKPFSSTVNQLSLRPLRRRVISTITGTCLPDSTDLRQLLREQLTAPVRFAEALAEAAKTIDLFLEVGPGQILTHLVGSNCLDHVTAISLDAAGSSLSGVLQAAAAAHVLGSQLRTEVFRDRFTRHFDSARSPHFFTNPCELAPVDFTTGDKLPMVGAPAKQNRKTRAPMSGDSEAGPSGGVDKIVRKLLAQRVELPLEAIQEGAHLLRDLHLNSIVVGEIVAAAARQMGLAPPKQLLGFADATVGETAKALERMRDGENGAESVVSNGFVGVDDWTRAFCISWTPHPQRKRSGLLQAPGTWRIFSSPSDPMADDLSQASLPGTGVLVCLPEDPAVRVEESSRILLEGAHASITDKGHKRYFVVLGPASVAAGFARTLHLEDPDILVRVIESPHTPAAIAAVAEEVNAPGGCFEVRYDPVGGREVSCLRLLEDVNDKEEPFKLDSSDVVLVSGGGKGIVAECSLALSRQTSAKLVILGRSIPENDENLATHLQRLAASGVTAKYFPVDVTDFDAVKEAVREAESIFGRVTGIIHGAGRNQPKLLHDLDPGALLDTLAPKVQGLRNLVAAVDAEHLRILITFGSVIGRVGLRGEADYSLANAYQSLSTAEFAHQHPRCHCLAFETSAWSGIGMAEHLGAAEALGRKGISAISRDQGIQWLGRLLARRFTPVSVVVMGRLGANSPLVIDGPQLPLWRFLEKPRVYYPGIELVADSEVTAASDPYLMDHVFQGHPLLPGVIALEAMAQAAMAVAGETREPVMEDVHFARPIVVESGHQITIRVSALARQSHSVEVVVRSSQTAFQVDHFRCTCRFRAPLVSADAASPPGPSRLAVDPEKDLYGKLLFHRGRFRRISGYRALNARACCAEIADESREVGSEWFSQYLPQALVLGDAAARDAALHSVQACVPHAVLLPVGVARLYAAPLRSREPLLAHARRRWRKEATYCYDVELRTPDGRLLERWEELRFQRVEDSAANAWPDPFVRAFLEWRIEETLPAAEVAVAFHRDATIDRRSRSELAIHEALGSPHPVRWRSSGEPEVQAGVGVSAAHSGGLTLAVTGPPPVACDLEPVHVRSEQVWRDLLGLDHWILTELIAREANEDVQTSATRVWTAIESLKKAGAPQDTPLVLLSCSEETRGCVSLASSGLRISSSIVQFRDDPTPFAISLLARRKECVTMNTVTVSALKKPAS